MRRGVLLSGLILLCLALFSVVRAYSAGENEYEIRQFLDRWTKAFRAKDVPGLMSMYDSSVVAYDMAPPLAHNGSNACRKEYEEFFAQYLGPLDIEFHRLSIVAGDSVAYSHGLERITGDKKTGEKSEVWLRFTRCYRRVNGHWLATHEQVSAPIDPVTGKGMLNLRP